MAKKKGTKKKTTKPVEEMPEKTACPTSKMSDDLCELVWMISGYIDSPSYTERGMYYLHDQIRMKNAFPHLVIIPSRADVERKYGNRLDVYEKILKKGAKLKDEIEGLPEKERNAIVPTLTSISWE